MRIVAGALLLVSLGIVAGFWILGARRVFGPPIAAGVALLLAGWSVASLLLAGSGLLSVHDRVPPPVLLPIAGAALAGLAFAASPAGGRFAREVPLVALIGFQAFRIPVELMLWLLHREGIAPVEMTFEGRNLDVLTGLLALAIAVAWRRREVPRAVAWGFEVVGLALLANVVIVAILTFESPLRSLGDVPNRVPLVAPFSLLPLVLVPSALAGHALVLRRLLSPAVAPREALSSS